MTTLKAKPRPELSGIVHRREGRDPREIGLQRVWKAPPKAREPSTFVAPVEPPKPPMLWQRVRKGVGRIFRHQSR